MELSSMPYFPVRDGDSGPCIGVVARSHLEAALQAACGGGPQAQLLPPMPTAPSSHATAHIDVVLQPISVVPACCDTASTPLQQLCGNEANYAADDEGLGDVVGAVVPIGDVLPLHSFMDRSPFTVVEDMPAPRLYALFAKAGEHVACVTSIRGELRGVISRAGLIAATRRGVRAV